VLKWYAAYCRPGTFTTGFNVWIVRQQFAVGASGYEADLRLYPEAGARTPCILLACLNPSHAYAVAWNGKAIDSRLRAKGLLEITLPAQESGGRLAITAIP
jgi:hypothetical protein